MRGVGTARGAVTIVNALPLGVGAALGIGLEVSAEVAVEPSVRGSEEITVSPRGSATPVVLAAARAAVAKYLPERPVSVDLRVSSAIPPSQGLKSSSAVASAVAGAVARAAGAPAPALEVARLSAEVGRRSGVSATGAFDDALAGLERGVVVTDNHDDRLLARFEVADDLLAVVWVPKGRHPPAPSLREAFSGRTVEAQAVVDLALSGAWPEAMERNSALVEQVLGYPYAGLRSACRQAGALAAGVSGLGPAFAVLTAPAAAPAIVDRLGGRDGRILQVPVGRPTPLPSTEGR